MNKSLSLVLASMILAAPALAQSAAATAGRVVAKEGEMLIDASGGRLAPVDRVDADGSAEILIDDHVAKIPASTLSIVNGHLTTSLKKSQVLDLQS